MPRTNKLCNIQQKHFCRFSPKVGIKYVIGPIRRIEEESRQKRRQRSSLLFGGQNLIYFLASLAILHQDDLQERMNRITAAWQFACFEKREYHKMDVLPKTFFKSSLLLNG